MKLSLQRIVLILMGLGIVGLIAYGFRPQPLPVDLATVTKGAIQVTVDEDGKTRVVDRFTVVAPLGGQLDRIELRAGNPIINGSSPTRLATIQPAVAPLLDPSAEAQALAAVEKAQAAIRQATSLDQRAKEAYEEASADLLRIGRLRGSSAFQQEEYDDAAFKKRMAAADLRAAGFAVQVANFELKQAEAVLLRHREDNVGEITKFEVFAPTSGKVFRIFEESETVVAPGQKLLEIGDPQDIEILIDVLSADAVRINQGDQVILEHWGGEKPLVAEVTVVEPSGYLKISALGVEEQRVNVIARLLSPLQARPNLGDGYRVEAKIVVENVEDVVKVAEGAIIRRDKGHAVYVVVDGKAELRPIVKGQSDGIHAEVKKGLKEGETVILHPSDKVEPGVLVAPRGGME